MFVGPTKKKLGFFFAFFFLLDFIYFPATSPFFFFFDNKLIYIMGKDKRSGGKAPRHDPLHVELADTPDQGMRRKATRQKFVDRNQQDQVEEVN